MKIQPQQWILKEDDDFLWVNKPAGISSLEDRHQPGGSMLEILRKMYGAEISLCHRLDKETSGLLLVSKNPAAYREAAIQFEKRQVKKIYHAVAGGQHDFKEETVDLPLKVTRSGQVVIDRGEGKPSFTTFNTLTMFHHFTLLEAKPLTGRMHQIRVHLAARRASIVGDTLYGGKPAYLSSIKKKYKMSGETETPLFQRVALHAFELSMEINGQTFLCQAPYPKDFAVFIKMLEKYDR